MAESFEGFSGKRFTVAITFNCGQNQYHHAAYYRLPSGNLMVYEEFSDDRAPSWSFLEKARDAVMEKIEVEDDGKHEL